MRGQNMQILVEELLKARTRDTMVNFLTGLLTPKEIEELTQRIEIVQLLKKGVAQHAIAAQLGVGVATVSRGAREIKVGNFQTI